MKKILKKYGNSNIIRISPEDMKIYELKPGDVVELHIKKLKGDDLNDGELER